VSVARELAKDAFLKTVIHDGVKIHTVCHHGRYRPAELETAITLGSPPTFSGKQCVECGKRWGLQVDHVNPVHNRGPTAYSNLQHLCWDHHNQKTERDRQAGLLGPNPHEPARDSFLRVGRRRSTWPGGGGR
jgi:5-methylcytosine-specific restriction endonuclease McrA